MNYSDDAFVAMLLSMALSPNREEYARPYGTLELKRLEERGVLKNEHPVITSLVTKDEVQLAELEEMMEKRFEGSLPAFVAAFAKQQNLSEEDVEEIRRIIDKGAR